MIGSMSWSGMSSAALFEKYRENVLDDTSAASAICSMVLAA